MRAICLAALMLCGTSVTAWGETLRHVRIETADARAVAQELERAGFDVVEGSITAGSLEIIASDPWLEMLKDRGFKPELIAVGRPFREIQAERQGAGDDVPPGYPDLDEVLAEMNAAATAYPDICEFVDLTERYNAPPTYEGRHMFAVKISDNVAQDEDEPAYLVVSNHHCREINTVTVALYAIEQFTTRYAFDPEIRALVDEYEIWIAPVWNPDGYVYVFNVDNMWRKNRQPYPGGIGVDLNRNYPFGWYSGCSGSSSPSSSTYKGPSPASEAETQTMITWSEDRRFAKVLDFHSSGRETLYAYNCHAHPFVSFLQSEATAISIASGYGGATRPPSAEGEHYEWQLAMMGVHAFLTEISYTFQPPYSNAEAEAVQLFPSLIWQLQRPISVSGHVTDAASGDPVEATITYVGVNFPNGETNGSGLRFGRYHAFLPPDTYTLEFSAEGYETQSHVVEVTPTSAEILDVELVVPAMRVSPLTGLDSEGPQGGPFTPDSITYTVSNETAASIDYLVTKSAVWIDLTNPEGTIPSGGDVQVVVSINSQADSLLNGRYEDAIEFINTTTHDGDTTRSVRLDVGTPAPIHVFNMDRDPGWTTQGQWAFGQPTGGGGEHGGPDPTSGHTGSNVYGYNLFGDYTNNMPQWHLTSTPIDCSDLINVRLRFRRWLGVEQPAYDHAYVRVSNDGLNWVTVWENTAEITDYAWSQIDLDISDVAENQPTVFLRWTMGETDGGWVYCGWNIDDVEIWAVVPGPECPGDFNGDLRVDLADLAILLAHYPTASGALYEEGDIDLDGDIDLSDLAALLAVYGTICE